MYPIEYEYVCEYNEEEEMERTKGRNERSERQQQNANQYSFTFNACKRRINMEKKTTKRTAAPSTHTTVTLDWLQTVFRYRRQDSDAMRATMHLLLPSRSFHSTRCLPLFYCLQFLWTMNALAHQHTTHSRTHMKIINNWGNSALNSIGFGAIALHAACIENLK